MGLAHRERTPHCSARYVYTEDTYYLYAVDAVAGPKYFVGWWNSREHLALTIGSCFKPSWEWELATEWKSLQVHSSTYTWWEVEMI